MNSVAAWPALRGSLPAIAEYQRAVWGKAHGAPSDFRWIARSANAARDRANLPVDLHLGSEDAPARYAAWRSIADCCYAVVGYPSRAIDATGRRGFLEKQIFEWRRPPDVPAAVGALLLLPRVASLTDEIWWERRGSDFWLDPDVYLSLDTPEPIAVDEDELAIAIERGRQQLRETVSSEALARLYDQLLSGRRPALLTGVPQSLPAGALAALLLPLPRAIADSLSLTGWVPAERASVAELGKRWDVLVLPVAQTNAFDPATEAQARRMADALLLFDTPQPSAATIAERPASEPAAPSMTTRATQLPKPGIRLPLMPPPPSAPRIVHELYAFAAAVDRRWLPPQSLQSKGRPPRLGSSYDALFASWVGQLHDEKPEWAHPRQWQVKIDVVRREIDALRLA